MIQIEVIGAVKTVVIAQGKSNFTTQTHFNNMMNSVNAYLGASILN